MLTRKHALNREAPQWGQSSHAKIFGRLFLVLWKAGSTLLSLTIYLHFFSYDASGSNLKHVTVYQNLIYQLKYHFKRKTASHTSPSSTGKQLRLQSSRRTSLAKCKYQLKFRNILGNYIISLDCRAQNNSFSRTGMESLLKRVYIDCSRQILKKIKGLLLFLKIKQEINVLNLLLQ